ncbi:hypothetical protein [Sinimarinibacterium thermocellulolyticum]|uniref:Uncharacterized protein n=1 Tax=Sinimarinibacterium thermocellulolyticum TaxID=3170016 RepID=A0ABV2ADP4_9GAMM
MSTTSDRTAPYGAAIIQPRIGTMARQTGFDDFLVNEIGRR